MAIRVKLDGFRALAYVDAGECRLVSRKKHTYKSFQPLCAAIAEGLKVENAILDGELVCIGPDGRPIFSQLLYRRGKPYLYAFDILWLNGQDLRKLPLVERKRRLRRLIPQQPFSAPQLQSFGTIPRAFYAGVFDLLADIVFDSIAFLLVLRVAF